MRRQYPFVAQPAAWTRTSRELLTPAEYGAPVRCYPKKSSGLLWPTVAMAVIGCVGFVFSIV